jgi:predicted transcriptional regulator
MATKERRPNSETDKHIAIQVIRQLPDNASFEDIAEEVAILQALRVAEEDIEAGRYITHEEMKRQVKTWFSK